MCRVNFKQNTFSFSFCHIIDIFINHILSGVNFKQNMFIFFLRYIIKISIKDILSGISFKEKIQFLPQIDDTSSKYPQRTCCRSTNNLRRVINHLWQIYFAKMKKKLDFGEGETGEQVFRTFPSQSVWGHPFFPSEVSIFPNLNPRFKAIRGQM